MASLAIQIEGLDKLRKKLADLPAKLERKVIRQALRAGAKIVLAQARALVPVDTGDLRRSLGIKTLRQRRKGTMRLAVAPRGSYFEGRQYYAGFVESGHKIHRGDAKDTAGDSGAEVVPAKPFMKPAYEATKNQAAAAIKAKLIEGIEREASSQ